MERVHKMDELMTSAHSYLERCPGTRKATVEQLSYILTLCPNTQSGAMHFQRAVRRLVCRRDILNKALQFLGKCIPSSFHFELKSLGAYAMVLLKHLAKIVCRVNPAHPCGHSDKEAMLAQIEAQQ